MKISANDLYLRLREMLDAVERGEEVTIIHRGKPRAKVVSVQAARRLRRKSARELPLFGIWKGHATIKDATAFISEQRRSRF